METIRGRGRSKSTQRIEQRMSNQNLIALWPNANKGAPARNGTKHHLHHCWPQIFILPDWTSQVVARWLNPYTETVLVEMRRRRRPSSLLHESAQSWWAWWRRRRRSEDSSNSVCWFVDNIGQIGPQEYWTRRTSWKTISVQAFSISPSIDPSMISMRRATTLFV